MESRGMNMHSTKIIAFIAVLVSFIIGASVYTTRLLDVTAESIEKRIHKLEDYTKTEDWHKANSEFEKIKKEWSKTQKTWTLLLDHFEIDNIDSTLARLKNYIEAQDKVMTLGETATFFQFIKHIPQKEAFNLKNIL